MVKRECEEFVKVFEESKKIVVKEEIFRKDEGGDIGGFDCVKCGSKFMIKKGFGLFSKDRSVSGLVINGENGDVIFDMKEKFKGWLSMSFGWKKSINILL